MNPSYLLKQLKISTLFLIVITLLFGIIYPLIITSFLQFFCEHKANGSIIYYKDKAIGSEFIGASFTDLRYFWGRPSATTPLPYDPTNSSGSNLSPSNPKFLSLIDQRVKLLNTVSGDNDLIPPIDLVTASASGLDPNISIAAARYQAERIAQMRKIDPQKLNSLINRMIIPRQLGFLGEPCINVLQLNLALDHEFERQ